MDTKYAKEQARVVSAAKARSLVEGLRSGDDGLWDEFILFRTYDESLGESLMLALDSADDCNGVHYVRAGLTRPPE